MTVQITTDPGDIRRLLEPIVLADPVRNTVFGTIESSLRDDTADAWCAQDPVALAARSGAARPVALTPGWTDLPGLAGALGELDDLAGVSGPVAAIEQLVALLARPPAIRTDERLYRLDELREPEDIGGTARPADPTEVDLTCDWFTSFSEEAHGGLPPRHDPREQVEAAVREGRLWVWTDPAGRPVSMAVRQPPVAGVARIGPVYTPAEHRAHGYGSAVTAKVARTILDDAAVPVLYTDRANATSNRIYQAIGFRPVTDRLTVRY
jgi:FR47-like protein